MGEYSKYPNQIDTSTELPKSTDLVTGIQAAIVNRLRDAILAIENELGIQPSASFSTVKARLDNIDVLIAGLGQSLTIFDGQTSANLSGIQSDIADLQSLTASMQILISIAQVDISALEAAMAIAQGDINTLEASMVTAQSDINALEAININAGAGLIGGGTLTGNITVAVAAADASITVNADSIAVGVISDVQHGNRAGGSLHSLAIAGGAAGFLSGTDKTKLDELSVEAGTYDVNPGDTAAEIEAAIAASVAANRSCRVAPGLYYLDAPVTITSSNTVFECPDGFATLVPRWSPNVSQADVRTNYVIGVTSTLGGASTTLNATCKVGSRTLTLTNTSGFGAGDWIYLVGWNGGDDDTLMSAGAEVKAYELVQIASVDSGTVVTLASRTKQHHANAKPAYRISAMVTNVHISNIAILADGYGDGYIGIGIAATRVQNLHIENIEIECLTRAGIDMLACHDSTVNNLYSYGEVNSWIALEGCINYRLNELNGNPNGLRQHSSGVPRAFVDQRGRCKWGSTTNAHFCHGNLAYREWGGAFLSLSDSSCEDMDATEAFARDSAMSSAGNITTGLAWDSGAPDVLTWADFSIGSTVTNYRIDAASLRSPYVHTASPSWWMCIFLHDAFRVTFTNINILNRGSAYEALPNTWVNGIDLRDCTGVLNNIHVSGCYAAMSTRNVYARVTASNIFLEAVAGNGANSQWGYLMGAAGGVGAEVEFHHLELSNFNGTEFEVGDEMALTPSATDWDLNWHDVNFDGYVAEYVVLARNTTTAFTTGQIAQFDDSISTDVGEAARMLKTPTAGAQDVCVVMKQDLSWCLVAPLPQKVTAGVDSAVTIGGLLAATTGRSLTSTSSQHLACARALRKTGNSKAAMIGGSGLGSGDFLLKTPATVETGLPNLLSTFTTNQSKIAWRLNTTDQSSITDLSGALTVQATTTADLNAASAVNIKASDAAGVVNIKLDGTTTRATFGKYKTVFAADGSSWVSLGSYGDTVVAGNTSFYSYESTGGLTPADIASNAAKYFLSTGSGYTLLNGRAGLIMQAGTFNMCSWAYAGGTTTTSFWDGEAVAVGLSLSIDTTGEVKFAAASTVTSMVSEIDKDASHKDIYTDSGWSAAEVKTHKRITFVDDGYYNDFTDGTTATIPCASGVTMRVQARLVVSDTFTGESNGTTSRSIDFACTVQNLAGTVTIEEDPGVTDVGAIIGGVQITAQFEVVASAGVKISISCPETLSYVHVLRAEAYITTFALTH